MTCEQTAVVYESTHGNSRIAPQDRPLSFTTGTNADGRREIPG